MTINTFSLQPICNSQIPTYSTQNKNTGQVVNLVCIAGFSKDGKKIKVEPFDYSSGELVRKAAAIAKNRLFGTVQIISSEHKKFVILQVDSSLKKHFNSDSYMLAQNNASESKICDLDGISYFDKAQLTSVVSIFQNWFNEAKQQ